LLLCSSLVVLTQLSLAMPSNKSLLDSLMGANRNLSKSEKAKGDPEWMKDDCCKDFLVGYCPGKAVGRPIETERNPFDKPSVIQTCTKLHSIGLKTEFAGHKDYEKYKRKYEDSLANLLDKAIKEVDEKVAHEKRKITEGLREMGHSERLCEICGLMYHLRFADVNVRDTENTLYKPDIHPESPLHKGYVKLRAKEAELFESIEKREPLPGDDKKEGRSSKDRSRGRDDDDEDGGRRRKRSRSRDKDREKGRDRKKGKDDEDDDREKGRDRKKGKDDEDDDREKGRDRDGGRKKGKEDDDDDDRDRGRDRRDRGGGGRDRDRGRDRSDSRRRRR